MQKTSKISKLALSIIATTMFVTASFADDFMQNARSFLEIVGASAEENQDYIARSNQFTAEGEFTADELAELLLIRAIVFSRLKDDANALESYAAALKSGNLPPILIAETRKNRGLLYYGNAQYAEAKVDFEKALNILSGNAELHYYFANSLFGLFDFDNAIVQYDLALEGMANNRFLAYYGKASVFYQQKLYEKSRENLIKSLDIKGNFEPSVTLLAQLDDFEAASAPLPTIRTTTEAEVSNISEEPTANEIYNQLLQQALAAKQSDGKSGQSSFKLKLDKENIDNLTTASIEPSAQASSDIQAKPLPETSPAPTLPEVSLRTNPQVFNLQVSETPFFVEQTGQPKRLDGLLSRERDVELSGFFLQLATSFTKETSEKQYQEILQKHQL